MTASCLAGGTPIPNILTAALSSGGTYPTDQVPPAQQEPHIAGVPAQSGYLHNSFKINYVLNVAETNSTSTSFPISLNSQNMLSRKPMILQITEYSGTVQRFLIWSHNCFQEASNYYSLSTSATLSQLVSLEKAMHYFSSSLFLTTCQYC